MVGTQVAYDWQEQYDRLNEELKEGVMFERRMNARRSSVDRREVRKDRRIRDGIGYLTVDQGRRVSVSERRTNGRRVLHRRKDDWKNSHSMDRELKGIII